VPEASGLAPEVERLLERLQQEGVKPGLEATRKLLKQLGSPQEQLSVVLVGGTNGKGSTATLLASFAAAAGYKASLYTSPHLESPRERIRIDGRAVDETLFGDTLREIVSTAERTPTYFEAMTIAAFLLSARQAVDLAIFEVGLGGRLDATNVADPILSVVTSIGLDHMEYLGDDLRQIAREKAGIFRPGRWAVSGVAAGPGRDSIEAEAERLGASYFAVDDLSVPMTRSPKSVRERSLVQRVDLQTRGEQYSIETTLAGAHQAENLRLAVAAAEFLRELGWNDLDRAAVEQGARSAHWPGRLESIDRPDRPAQAGYRVLLDVAHNLDGIESLVAFLKEVKDESEVFTLLFGALEDKPAAEMLSPLRELAGSVILSCPESPRAAWWPSGEELPGVVRERSIVRALDRALEMESGRTVVVCGSIFLVGPVRAELSRRWPEVVTAAPDCDLTRRDLT